MTLLDLREGSVVEIAALPGGAMLADRLRAHGLYAGTKVRLVKVAPFGGPLLIEDVSTGVRVMIGRCMAGSIEVLDGDPSQP